MYNFHLPSFESRLIGSFFCSAEDTSLAFRAIFVMAWDSANELSAFSRDYQRRKIQNQLML